jgi:hypothetical protein
MLGSNFKARKCLQVGWWLTRVYLLDRPNEGWLAGWLVDGKFIATRAGTAMKMVPQPRNKPLSVRWLVGWLVGWLMEMVG